MEECSEETARNVDDRTATVKFGERGKKERADGIAEYVNGNHEGTDSF